MRFFCLLIFFLLASKAVGQDVGTQQFLYDFSQQHGFDVHGLELLGSETLFVQTDTQPVPEDFIARALRRYNHVVKYTDGKISDVVIYSRKGKDVGSLPETYESPDMPEEN